MPSQMLGKGRPEAGEQIGIIQHLLQAICQGRDIAVGKSQTARAYLSALSPPHGLWVFIKSCG